MTTRPLISVFIICYNEEKAIRRCLESVRWADEIIVVDSGSSDRTIDICREFTEKIHVRPWPGHRAQKEFGLSKCANEWVLNIDADEEVSPELHQEIVSTISTTTPYAGFELSRVVFFLGRWWRRGGWYPEFRLRLIRKSLTTWGGTDPHEKAVVKGATSRLTCELRHYTYSGFHDQIAALNNHSTALAKTLHECGVRANIFDVLFRPVARWIKFYILKQGFREGMAGFLVAGFEAGYVLMKYGKLWELGRR